MVLFILAALFTVRCGSSYAPDPPGGNGQKARPLASIYDFVITIPGMLFPQLSSQGLTVEMTLEIDPQTTASSPCK